MIKFFKSIICKGCHIEPPLNLFTDMVIRTSSEAELQFICVLTNVQLTPALLKIIAQKPTCCIVCTIAGLMAFHSRRSFNVEDLEELLGQKIEFVAGA